MTTAPRGTPDAPWRLAYLTNIPSPYRAAMIRTWAARNPGLSLSVFYTDPDDQGRGWAADAIGNGVVESRLPVATHLGRYGKLNRGLAAMVRSHDVVMIGGFEQGSYLAAALLAKAMGKPVVLLFDGFSPARFDGEHGAIVALKRLTARLADGFFANGTVSERYLRERIGIAADRPVFNQTLSHRDEPIRRARETGAAMGREALRRNLGIDPRGRPVLLVCGYLVERKRIDLVIDAVARLDAPHRPLLLVVGDGELAATLETRARQAGVLAHFAGFHLGEDLARHFVAADLFVLASSDDPWGLVVNEAMAAGLPVVVSDACGAALDLVAPGENGWTFCNGDVDNLADRLRRVLGADMAAMGQRSQTMIASWSPEQSARNLGLLVTTVMDKCSPGDKRER